MRHVLFIHYHFLPVHNVAVKRLLGYAKELPAFGWRVSVLTKDWRGLDEADPSWGLSWEPERARDAGCAIYRAPDPSSGRRRRPSRATAVAPVDVGSFASKLAAKAARMARMLPGRYPDELVAWARPAAIAGAQVARRDPIDAILSYCPPETNHVAARRLARRLGVPWVPFFGDMYGFLDAALPALSVEGALRKRYHRWCLAPAAACAAVSPYMVDYLARTYGKRAELVLTGFDPEEFSEVPVPRRPRRERLVVSHVGSLYPGDQRPEVFFDGLDELLTRRPELASRLEVRFVGSKCDAALGAALAGRLAARVCRIEPKVDSATAVAIVRSSDALLAFTCSSYRDRHGTLSYPTKIFEAFAARRPVLVVPPDGDWVDELVTRTGGGAGARDGGAVAARLSEWLADWERTGEVPYHGRPAEIAALSRPRQAERLARLFDSVC